jgi:hypothetical protein
MNEHLLESELKTIVERVDTVAQECGDDSDRLLALLRTLEGLHRRREAGPISNAVSYKPL